MLKRKDSPYLAGRPKGLWWKWKRDAHLLDVRADVRPARPRQAVELLLRLHLRRLARRRGRPRAGARSARPISASPTRSCASSTAGSATTPRSASARSARSTPALVLEVAFDSRPPLDPAQIRRRDALSPRPPHPLGQAGGRGRPPGHAGAPDRVTSHQACGPGAPQTRPWHRIVAAPLSSSVCPYRARWRAQHASRESAPEPPSSRHRSRTLVCWSTMAP